MLHCFWISIKGLLFSWIYCYILKWFLKKLRSRKKTVVLSSWLVVIFRILSYVINICLTGWSKRFYHNIKIIYFYSPKIISFVTFFCASSSNHKTKSVFTPCKLGSINQSNYWFSFLFILLIDIFSVNCSFKTRLFNCSSIFAFSLVDKVTMGHQVLYQLLKLLWFDLHY